MSNQPEKLSYLCSELVSVLFEDQRCNTRSTFAVLEEISADSAILLSEERPPAGRPIAFSAKGHDFYGTVRSIDKDETLGYFTNVEFDARCRWQGQLFVPEHFFALCASTRQAVAEGAATAPIQAFTLGER
jgi:hypothetical protein